MSVEQQQNNNDFDLGISHEIRAGMIKIDRPAYSLDRFENEFANREHVTSKSSKSTAKKIHEFAIRNLNPLRLFTIINLFWQYKLKDYLIPDILSGITGSICKTN